MNFKLNEQQEAMAYNIAGAIVLILIAFLL